MSKRKVIVSARAIAALLPFASKDETRYYLNGIKIEPARADFGGVLLIATDGHKLAVVHDLLGQTDGEHIVSIPSGLSRLLGRSATRTALKTRAHFIGNAVHLVDEDFPDTLDATEPTEHHLFTGYGPDIEGDYPAWRKVFDFARERRHAGLPVTLNAVNISDFINAANVLKEVRNGPAPFSVYSPEIGAPSLITAENNEDGLAFVGLLMPMRNVMADAGMYQPGWIAPVDPESPQKIEAA